jgi:hypothetical protein
MKVVRPDSNINRIIAGAAARSEVIGKHRLRLLLRLKEINGDVSGASSLHLRKILKIGQAWRGLDFTRKDWSELYNWNHSGDFEANILFLVVKYIILNKERVQRVSAIDEAFTRDRTGGAGEAPERLISLLDYIDSQSLYVIRSKVAYNVGKPQAVIHEIRNGAYSKWVKQRLLIPLVHYNTVESAPSAIDVFLSSVVGYANNDDCERKILKLTLRDDFQYEAPLFHKLFLALAAHPYDSLEIITNHFEIEFAREDRLSKLGLDALNVLAEKFPFSRIAKLRTYIEGFANPDRSWVNGSPPTVLNSGLNQKTLAFLDAWTDCKAEEPKAEHLPSIIWEPFSRMRWSRYPNPEDFQQATGFAMYYSFTEIGRLFGALLESLFMVSRQDEVTELRSTHRLHSALGKTTPFLWASPRGWRLMKAQMEKDVKGWLGADLQAGAILRACSGSNTRVWILATHWELNLYKKRQHLRNWLNLIQSRFEIKPRFLTGVDWSWIDESLERTRIRPYVETIAGPYALLLRAIEETRDDGTILRTALSTFSKAKTCSELVDFLANEYGENAMAFVRYFLTPENIMRMKLAPNLTAALSERIEAIENCVARFGYTEVMGEEQVHAEQQTLSSALMLLNVNANQFDIPWSRFKSEVIALCQDSFEANAALRISNSAYYSADDITSYPHRYKNGRTVEYRVPSTSVAFCSVIFTIIDFFYGHPSFGIEAILSTRFRHDTLRREFRLALEAIGKAYSADVSRAFKRDTLPTLQDAALEAFDGWLNTEMQTVRPKFEAGLFDFSILEGQLLEMLDKTSEIRKLEKLVDVVTEWLVQRLDVSIDKARTSFNEQCVSRMASAVRNASSVLALEPTQDQASLNSLTRIVNDSISRQAQELKEWFERPDDNTQQELTFDQIRNAVEGRFEYLITTKRLRISKSMADSANTKIPKEKVKLYFDLLSEVVTNSIKHGYGSLITLRITYFQEDGLWGFIYSNFQSCPISTTRLVAGKMYESITDSLFREGNSGLSKISALAASIVEANLSVTVFSRKKAFHLKVPLGRVVH